MCEHAYEIDHREVLGNIDNIEHQIILFFVNSFVYAIIFVIFADVINKTYE